MSNNSSRPTLQTILRARSLRYRGSSGEAQATWWQLSPQIAFLWAHCREGHNIRATRDLARWCLLLNYAKLFIFVRDHLLSTGVEAEEPASQARPVLIGVANLHNQWHKQPANKEDAWSVLGTLNVPQLLSKEAPVLEVVLVNGKATDSFSILYNDAGSGSIHLSHTRFWPLTRLSFGLHSMATASPISSAQAVRPWRASKPSQAVFSLGLVSLAVASATMFVYMNPGEIALTLMFFSLYSSAACRGKLALVWETRRYAYRFGHTMYGMLWCSVRRGQRSTHDWIDRCEIHYRASLGNPPIFTFVPLSVL